MIDTSSSNFNIRSDHSISIIFSGNSTILFERNKTFWNWYTDINGAGSRYQTTLYLNHIEAVLENSHRQAYRLTYNLYIGPLYVVFMWALISEING